MTIQSVTTCEVRMDPWKNKALVTRLTVLQIMALPIVGKRHRRNGLRPRIPKWMLPVLALRWMLILTVHGPLRVRHLWVVRNKRSQRQSRNR
ncbi:hypothetical protein BIFGAL_03649 [Bifidobacterium gallicum DSM 20093 = LMG 11596]|uniref:Uncharacterized protein n=1 Tax=Bifidobacterium gallicum DSM 20093 = LMG 11596 TaxID=561180 RepID=D1NUX1_9BIFI|nr:hypothetical protein BIFGAL_03649 [Bifidobacterium gallicum DSM 20093 = LMG 11596]